MLVHKGGQQGDAIGAALSGGLHAGDGGVAGGGQIALGHAGGLENAAVAGHAVDLHVLLGQDVHAKAHGGDLRIDAAAHEVGQAEMAVRLAHHQGAARVQVGDALAGHVVIHQHAAAVGLPLQALLIELGEDLARGHVAAEQAQGLPQQTDPGVDVRGAVVAVDHGHVLAGGGCDHVDLSIDLAQGFFQHHHGKNRSTGGHVARAGGHGVGGHHTGARVALRGREGQSLGQQALHPGGAGRRQTTRVLPSQQHPGQHVPDVPGLILGERLELFQHLLVPVAGGAVDGEHAGGLAHAHHVFPGEHIVDIGGQGGDVGDLADVSLAVQNGLIQVGDAPPLGHVELEQLGELLRRVGGDGVLPGAEGHQQVPVLVKGQIAVHHAGDTGGGQALPVLQLAEHLAQALPGVGQVIGPDAVVIGALPLKVPGLHGSKALVDDHARDAGGAQLHA